MAGIVSCIYGAVAYMMFLITFLYAIAFVGNVAVPKSIDSATTSALMPALLANLTLLGLFALQHSIMARVGFKKLWTRLVPEAVERSTFVLFTSLVLALLFWQWQALPAVLWQVDPPMASGLLIALSWIGWGIVLLATFTINHFDLFGLRQVWFRLREKEYVPLEFKTSGMYNYVRHPLLLGFMIAFWATPRMTAGHLLFAGATTAYMLIAIQLEERDLVKFHGEAYVRYQRQVGMLWPWRKKETRIQTEAAMYEEG